MTTGLVGLGLSLWWMIAQPFADFWRGRFPAADRALVIMFLQIWVFALCLACYELVFFAGGSGQWVLTMSAHRRTSFPDAGKECRVTC